MYVVTHPILKSRPYKISAICENGEYAVYPGDCTRYRHCLFGKFEVYSCSSGLHWNKVIEPSSVIILQLFMKSK